MTTADGNGLAADGTVISRRQARIREIAVTRWGREDGGVMAVPGFYGGISEGVRKVVGKRF